DAGLYGIWVPERYGGTDAGCLALALVCEEIAWACAATATQYLDQPLGGLPILRFGTEAQKTKYLPRLATGELLAAYSLSEPGDRLDGRRHRAGGARRRGGVRPGATPVRAGGRSLSGYPVHARRHGDAGPRRAPHGPPRRPSGGRGDPRQHVRGVDGEVLGRRRRDEGRDRRHPGLRRLRLHTRVPRRALHAGREDHADLRG